MAQACNFSTGEAKTGGSLRLTRPGSPWENLSPKVPEEQRWGWPLTSTRACTHAQRHRKHTQHTVHKGKEKKEARRGREVTTQLLLCSLITERNSNYRMHINEMGWVSSSIAREADGSAVQGYPWLHWQFYINLNYKKSCLKKEGDFVYK